jgi:phospholipase C
MLSALMLSDAWASSALMVTYDDWGGWYDHVRPPQVDQYGYGFRVPALLVGAYARRGYIDSTRLDHTSALRFIEDNWQIPPLAERDAQANTFISAFDFAQPPRPPVYVSAVRPTQPPRLGLQRASVFVTYGIALAFALVVIAMAALGPRARHASRSADTPD